MLKSILLLVVLVATVYSQVVPSAYGIWNDPTTNTVNAGIVNLVSANSTSYFNYPGNTFTTNSTSTYNKVTGLISFTCLNTETNLYHLATLDTKTWIILNYTSISTDMSITNLAYDQTDSEYNLFATMITGSNEVYVAKLSVNEAYYKTIDTISNAYPNATATFLGGAGKLILCYMDVTTGNTFCKYYDTELNIEGPILFQYANIAQPWVPYSSPYLMSYLPNLNLTICQITLRNLAYAGYYGGPQMFWVSTGASQFYNNGWITGDLRVQMGQQNMLFSDFTLPRVYQFAVFQRTGAFRMYTYSTYNDQWIKYQQCNVLVINAWSFQ